MRQHDEDRWSSRGVNEVGVIVQIHDIKEFTIVLQERRNRFNFRFVGAGQVTRQELGWCWHWLRYCNLTTELVAEGLWLCRMREVGTLWNGVWHCCGEVGTLRCKLQMGRGYCCAAWEVRAVIVQQGKSWTALSLLLLYCCCCGTKDEKQGLRLDLEEEGRSD